MLSGRAVTEWEGVFWEELVYSYIKAFKLHLFKDQREWLIEGPQI